MAITGREIARRVDGRTEVRPDAIRCRIRLDKLATSDAHAIEAVFTCGVIALERAVELKMLTEALLSERDAATVDDVIAHFTPPLHDAAMRAVEKHPAEHWLDESGRRELLETLRSRAGAVAFNCGIELLSPFDLTLSSPTVQREKLDAMQRKLVERRAAGQAEHVQRAAELLKQFQSLREAAPALSPGQVLDQISPADRGSMLQTLLLASASSGMQTLWAVAGPNLLKIDPRVSPPRTELIPLPTELGPLRSVQGGEVDGRPVLLIGAQRGVMVINPQQPTENRAYADPEVVSPLGFNSVVATETMIWGTHGEAGMVAWQTDRTDHPAFTIRPQPGSDGPRNAAVLDDRRVLYSAGGSVFAADGEGKVEPVGSGGAGVVFIAVDDAHVSIVRSWGLLELLDRVTLQSIRAAQRCGEVTAAGTLPWLGTTRLLMATSDGPICCVGGEDSLVTQYASVHRGLREIAAAADVVAAISPDRQRVVLWRSWDGTQPAAEIHIATLARHRAADVCFS